MSTKDRELVESLICCATCIHAEKFTYEYPCHSCTQINPPYRKPELHTDDHSMYQMNYETRMYLQKRGIKYEMYVS